MLKAMTSHRFDPAFQVRGHRSGRRQKRRSAFTLVELLVAMAVTLILIFALAQAFAIVGDVVAEGRATVEMSGSLRSVANRLQQDLDGITAPVRPWLDPASGLGYFEIVDGPSGDADFNANGILDTNSSDPDYGVSMYGDLDDVLAFTTRSKDKPFIGERTFIDRLGNPDATVVPATRTLQSTLAEVVWWVQFDDAPMAAGGLPNHNGNGTYDAGEPFTVYRRALLIRPDLGTVFSQVGAGNAYANNPTGLAELQSALIGFFNSNDISVRIEWWLDGNGINVRLIANSLAELTNRENRFAHQPVLSDRSTSGQFNLAPVAVDLPWPALRGNGVFPHAMDLNRRSVTSLYRAPKTGANAGEDVMLVNTLAFDVRVFDPDASVRYEPSVVEEAMTPGDPGYLQGITPPINVWPQNVVPPNIRPVWLIGFGAFVDLGYGYNNTSGTGRLNISTPGIAGATAFSGAPDANSGLDLSGTASGRHVFRTPCFSYCTWSTFYERNGVNENNNTDANGNPLIDESTNGFDDDRSNGVDDVGERETSPPYPTPLRGIRVSIRSVEPDTRQVRQVSVTSDFLPE
jgi:type II secretory pathway pseudopilin PulG